MWVVSVREKETRETYLIGLAATLLRGQQAAALDHFERVDNPGLPWEPTPSQDSDFTVADAGRAVYRVVKMEVMQ